LSIASSFFQHVPVAPGVLQEGIVGHLEVAQQLLQPYAKSRAADRVEQGGYRHKRRQQHHFCLAAGLHPEFPAPREHEPQRGRPQQIGAA
jgi:hypothetical protein